MQTIAHDTGFPRTSTTSHGSSKLARLTGRGISLLPWRDRRQS